MQLKSLYVKHESSESPGVFNTHIAGALEDGKQYLGYSSFPGRVKILKVHISVQFPPSYQEGIFYFGDNLGNEVPIIIPFETPGGTWESTPEDELYLEANTPLILQCFNSGGCQYANITVFYVYSD